MRSSNIKARKIWPQWLLFVDWQILKVKCLPAITGKFYLYDITCVSIIKSNEIPTFSMIFIWEKRYWWVGVELEFRNEQPHFTQRPYPGFHIRNPWKVNLQIIRYPMLKYREDIKKTKWFLDHVSAPFHLPEKIKTIKSILKTKTSSSSFTREDKVFLMVQITVF